MARERKGSKRVSTGVGVGRGWGVGLLLVVFVHAARATGASREQRGAAPASGLEAARVDDMEVWEPGGALPLVPIGPAAFQRAVQRLSRGTRLSGQTPREAARAWLGVTSPPDPDAERVEMAGQWLLEHYADRGYTFVPRSQTGPVPLVPEADAALKQKYLKWCAPRGGGDCLGLLEDGPYLRTDDRRTLALALALGPVLDETRAALARELLDARALVSMMVWSVAFYCVLWVVPEPTTKALAASLTVVLMAWLGVETLWGLMDGWSRLAGAAHEATTFEELRAAGESFGQLVGQDAARTMILAVATLGGRTVGEVGARVKSLPGYGLAGARWEAQGGAAVLTPGVGETLAQAVTAVEEVAVSSSLQGALTVVLLKKGGGGGAAAPGGRASATVLRHRGGNQQVELANGQRWHLPRGNPSRIFPPRTRWETNSRKPSPRRRGSGDHTGSRLGKELPSKGPWTKASTGWHGSWSARPGADTSTRR